MASTEAEEKDASPTVADGAGGLPGNAKAPEAKEEEKECKSVADCAAALLGNAKAHEAKEKKRKLILSDSEDSDYGPLPTSSKTHVARDDQKGVSSATRKIDEVECLKRKDDRKAEGKSRYKHEEGARSANNNAFAATTSGGKRVVDGASIGKKRPTDDDSEITVKRFKMDLLKHSHERSEELREKKTRRDFSKHEDERKKFKANGIPESKPAVVNKADRMSGSKPAVVAEADCMSKSKPAVVVKADRMRMSESKPAVVVKADCISESKPAVVVKAGHISETKPATDLARKNDCLKERNKEIKQEKSDKFRRGKPIPKTKRHSDSDDEMHSGSRQGVAKREGALISKGKGVNFQTKGTTSGAFLIKNKERIDVAMSRNTRIDERKTRSLDSPKREKKDASKSIPPLNTRKTQPAVQKSYSDEKGKSGWPKKVLKISSPEEKMGRKISSGAKVHAASKSQEKQNDNPSRRTVMQKIREQIKTLLLNAGWRIDLRPRRGRDYEDQVYVSPAGHGYWSITKAYNVYIKSGSAVNDHTGESTKEGRLPSLPSVPLEVLNMLKRNVVNKRGSKKQVLDGWTNGDIKKRKKDKKSRKEIKRRKIMDDTKKSGGQGTIQRTQQNKKRKGRCPLLARGANLDAGSEDDSYIQYVWKRTIFSWLIDLDIVAVNSAVRYMNKRRSRVLLEGHIRRDGIHCNCCSKVLSAAKFEVHAGSKLHQPYENIYVENTGASLLECQLNAWKKSQHSSKNRSFYDINVEGDDSNDDTCAICGDGGDLICCDSCPATFHLSCLGIKALPPGDWNCMHCSCKFCQEVSISVLKGTNEKLSALVSCMQCEAKYHQSCVPEAVAGPSGTNKSRRLFCGESCKRVFNKLQKLVGVKNDLESGFSWSIIRHFDEDLSKERHALAEKAECNSKIAVSFHVMDECFLPIFDQRSDINLIHNVVYNCGSNFKRLNFNGFYTFLLERNDEIICAASVRIHGTRLAEMPFIGTRIMYRRQGMCRLLLTGIENALSSLNIERLIIPAIPELTETWTTVFGFEILNAEHKQELRHLNMLVFPGTGLMQKAVLPVDSVEHCNTDNGGNCCEPELMKHDNLDDATGSSLVSNIKNKMDKIGTEVSNFVGDKKSVSEILLEAPDASQVSECQTPVLSTTADACTELVRPEVLHPLESPVEDKSQVCTQPKESVSSPHEKIMHVSHNAGNEDNELKTDIQFGCHALDNSDRTPLSVSIVPPPVCSPELRTCPNDCDGYPSVLEDYSVNECQRNAIHGAEGGTSVSGSGMTRSTVHYTPGHPMEEDNTISSGVTPNSAMSIRPDSAGPRSESEASARHEDVVDIKDASCCHRDSRSVDAKVTDDMKMDISNPDSLKASTDSNSVLAPFSDGLDCVALKNGTNISKQDTCLIPSNGGSGD